MKAAKCTLGDKIQTEIEVDRKGVKSEVWEGWFHKEAR